MDLIITDIEGKQVKITDLKAAYEEAKRMVKLHRQAKKHVEKHGIKEEPKTGQTIHYFKDAHAYWEQILKQLQILKDKQAKS